MGYDETLEQMPGRIVTQMSQLLAAGRLACNQCQNLLNADTGRIVRTPSSVFAVHVSRHRCKPKAGQPAAEAGSRWFRGLDGPDHTVN